MCIICATRHGPSHGVGLQLFSAAYSCRLVSRAEAPRVAPRRTTFTIVTHSCLHVRGVMVVPLQQNEVIADAQAGAHVELALVAE